MSGTNFLVAITIVYVCFYKSGYDKGYKKTGQPIFMASLFLLMQLIIHARKILLFPDQEVSLRRKNQILHNVHLLHRNAFHIQAF